MSSENYQSLGVAAAVEIQSIVQNAFAEYQKATTSEEVKDKNDLVTSADRAVEKSMTKMLGSLLPGSSVRGEEGSVSGGEGVFEWVIDPIDGTVNFARNINIFSTATALLQSGQPQLSVVYIPSESHAYIAVRGGGVNRLDFDAAGGGATVPGKPIRISSKPSGRALYSIMITPKLSLAARASSFKFADWTLQNSLGFRVLVGQAYEAVKLIEGGISAVVSFHSSGGWTRDACRLLCEEAGGSFAAIVNERDESVKGFVLAASQSLLTDLEEPFAGAGYSFAS